MRSRKTAKEVGSVVFLIGGIRYTDTSPLLQIPSWYDIDAAPP